MFACGGNYNNGTNAGVFYTNGNNNTRTNTSANNGFRSALPQIKARWLDGYGFQSGPRGKGSGLLA